MEDFKKFDLNEKTETTASDSTAPVKSEGEQPTAHHERLKILARLMGDDYYDSGQYHNKISDAMQEYSDLQKKQAHNEILEACIKKVIVAAGIRYFSDKHANNVLGVVMDELEKLKR